ncbi:hypothetical protein [Streptomyces tanashiensis]|uniref:hypothetical protein n=1 Tax=Streptomyces tanashiensis TaxID=67367 RepID=UPI001678276D|nr:hypothetical protein [Streptomyces tanashiensis]
MSSQEELAVPGGTIRISRDRAEPSEAFRVWIDDLRVGLLRAGQEAVFPVPSGPHRVQLRAGFSVVGRAGDSEVLQILVEPGEVVCFDSRVLPGLWVNKILLHRRGDPSISEPSGSSAADARVLGVTQMTRIEELLGEDVRLIDNRASPAPVTRSLKASREWTRTLTLGEDRRETLGGNVSANLLWLSAKGSIEAELQRTLSLAIGSTHLFEEEIGVTIPERTAVRIVLSWKRIWQCGEARVLLPDRSVHIVPYQVVVSVTFDQKIQDVTSLPDG